MRNSNLQNLGPQSRSGPFFDTAESVDSGALKVPEQFESHLESVEGREGFVGEIYLRLYRLLELPALNQAYEVGRYLPGYTMFGSTGGGEGYFVEHKHGTLLRIPMIPMLLEFSEVVGRSLPEFLKTAASGKRRLEADTDTIGLELHEIKPIVFGGDPEDPQNKTLLSPPKHAEAVRHWNQIFRDLRSKGGNA